MHSKCKENEQRNLLVYHANQSLSLSVTIGVISLSQLSHSTLSWDLWRQQITRRQRWALRAYLDSNPQQVQDFRMNLWTFIASIHGYRIGAKKLNCDNWQYENIQCNAKLIKRNIKRRIEWLLVG